MFAIPSPQDCKVALIAGGSSGERDISLASGQGAKKALEQAGYQVTLLDHANADDLRALLGGGFDIAFLCTHGRGGEDGALQGFLETIGLPYIGSGVAASAVAMHKGKAKLFYESAGVPTPDSLTISKGQGFDLDDVIAQVGAHCAVKAITEGSTLGLYIVDGRDALAQALVDVFGYDDQALVERFVAGRARLLARCPSSRSSPRTTSTTSSPSTRRAAPSTSARQPSTRPWPSASEPWPCAPTTPSAAPGSPAPTSSSRRTAVRGFWRRTPCRA